MLACNRRRLRACSSAGPSLLAESVRGPGAAAGGEAAEAAADDKEEEEELGKDINRGDFQPWDE